MMENKNPIEYSIKWLIECGYTEEEAENIIRAIRADSAEQLSELAPKWITHAGEHKKYQTMMLDLVAQGVVSVSANETGEWLFALNERGMEIGNQMFGGAA